MEKFKKEIPIAEGVKITINSDHQLSNEEIKKYLKASIYHDALKDPVIKELFGFRADRAGLIEHYKLESRGSCYILTNDNDTPGISVNKSTLNEYLCSAESKPLILEREFGNNIEVIFGFTEEEVRKRVMKYYLP